MEPLIDVKVEINPINRLFLSPFKFQITFDCLSTAGLKEGTLKNFSSDFLCFLASAEIELSVIYVGNPDQVCS
jgi:hypothetical protein